MAREPVLKQAAHWLLPPGVQQVARSLRNGLRPGALARRAAHRRLLASNETLRNRHAGGDRCFILACGPSINRQELACLEGEACISVSNFFVHKDYGLISPAYHCVPDILAGHQGFVTEEYALEWLRTMERATGQAVMVFSCGDKAWIDRAGLFTDRTVRHVLFGGSWEAACRTGIDLTKPLPHVQSVSILALMVALYLGFGKIYLLGFDHDWLLHLDTSAHFYPEETNPIARRPGYDERKGTNVELECATYVQLWRQYRMLQSIAARQNVEIFNATLGGMLDVFPRVALETVCPGVRGSRAKAGDARDTG